MAILLIYPLKRKREITYFFFVVPRQHTLQQVHSKYNQNFYKKSTLFFRFCRHLRHFNKCNKNKKSTFETIIPGNVDIRQNRGNGPPAGPQTFHFETAAKTTPRTFQKDTVFS